MKYSLLVALVIFVSVGMAGSDIGYKTDYNWQYIPLQGGIVPCIVANPTDADRAIALSFNNSWKTNDGENWSKHSLGGIYNNGDVLYLPSGNLLYFCSDTIFLSYDDGNTLNEVFLASGNIRTTSRNVSDTVLVATSNRIYITEDGGFVWDSISVPFSWIDYLEFAPGNDSIIYMATYDFNDTTYIRVSNDKGSSWNTVYTFENVEVQDIEINPFYPNEVFISTGIDNSDGLVYTNDGFVSANVFQQIMAPNDVEFLSNDTIIVASSFPVGVLMGVRSLGSWNFYVLDSLTPSLTFAISGNTIYCGTNTGIMKSIDGGHTWQVKETGLYAVFEGEIAPPHSHLINNKMYISGYYGNALYKTQDGGQTWTKSYIPGIVQVFDIDASASNPDIVYIVAGGGEYIGASVYAHNIYFSPDGGNTIIPMDTISAGNIDNYAWKNVIHVSPTDHNLILVAIDDDTLDMWYYARSTDGGQTFSILNQAEDIYRDIIGTDTVFISADSFVISSYDMGNTYNVVDHIGNRYVTSMDYSPQLGKLIYSYYTNVSGINSYCVSYDLNTGNIDTIYTDNYYFYGASINPDGSVFLSGAYAGEFIFVKIDTSVYVDTTDFYMQTIESDTDKVIAISPGGIYISTDPVTGMKEKSGAVLNKKVLSWNMKENKLLINGNLDNFTFEIYTLDGRRILKKKYKVGTESIKLNGLVSGVYYVRIEDKNKRLFQKKIVVLK